MRPIYSWMKWENHICLLLLCTFVCRTRNKTTTQRRLNSVRCVCLENIRLSAFLLWALITFSPRRSTHTFFNRETRLELAARERCSIIIASRPSIHSSLCAKVKGGHADKLLFLRVALTKAICDRRGAVFISFNERFAATANLESEFHCTWWWWESHHDTMLFVVFRQSKQKHFLCVMRRDFFKYRRSN